MHLCNEQAPVRKQGLVGKFADFARTSIKRRTMSGQKARLSEDPLLAFIVVAKEPGNNGLAGDICYGEDEYLSSPLPEGKSKISLEELLLQYGGVDALFGSAGGQSWSESEGDDVDSSCCDLNRRTSG